MGIDYLAHLRADTETVAAATRNGPLDAPVDGCPGWDLGRLVGHLGRVHAMATGAVRTGAPPDPANQAKPPKDADAAALADWYAATATDLLDVLAAADPDAPAWNFSAAPQVASFWPRRQAHETAVHRWDAESAAGVGTPIDAELAVDGIDELLEVFVPTRLAGRDGIDIGGSVHLHATDADGEWTFRTDDGVFQVTRGHVKGDVAVRGPASDLLLVLWRREPPTVAGVEVLGDPLVFDRWLALNA